MAEGKTETIARPPNGSIRRVSLHVIAGPGAGATVVSRGERTVVGSHETADLVLPDPAVSRFHCEITVDGDSVIVKDLGSRNGTVLGGVSVREAIVSSGAQLLVGRSRVRVDLDAGFTPRAASEADRFGSLVGQSLPMREAFALLEKAAASRATVLLLGETGTGKEAAAESLHAASDRAAGPFLVVDCASVPANLLESELFGHERGAFTGAHAARDGAFEEANGGTVFLDEIGELPSELQPKLLRAIERREVKRVGANRYTPIDVRIVAATHRDLRAEVNGGRFRADLFYRLAVVTIRLPALRERTEDLPLLVTALASRMDGPGAVELLNDPGFLAEIAGHTWPGNVRELRNYLERTIALGSTTPLDEGATAGATEVNLALPIRVARERCVAAFEKAYLEGQLRRAEGNASAAARASDIDRRHFYRLLFRYGIR